MMSISKARTIIRNLKALPQTAALHVYPCVKKASLQGDREYGRFLINGLEAMDDEFGVRLEELTPIVLGKTEKSLPGNFIANLKSDPPTLIAVLDKPLKEIMSSLRAYPVKCLRLMRAQPSLNRAA